MKLVFYGNCQMDGVRHFIKKVHPNLDIRVWHNWRIILGEEDAEGLMRDAADCDVFLYQPSAGLKPGMRSTEEMLKETVPQSALRLSFAYCFNTGFFPIVRHGQWWTGEEVIRLAKTGAPMVEMFDNDELISYDCARRFTENLAEQSRREEGCNLKFAPWILQNFQTKHLFLLCNHPASALFVEMAQTVLRAIDPALDCEIKIDHPNEANLPGYHAVHPAVVRELGLQYEPDRRGEDPIYYRKWMQELADTKGVL